MRIRFLKKGGQREFLDAVRDSLRVSSIRGILQFGFNVPYSTLKNYYSEVRLMDRDLVLAMCEVSGLRLGDFEVEEVGENWGQVKGGEISKRK